MPSSRSYDVVLLPPVDVSRQASKLSNRLSSTFAAHFVLDGKIKYPHVTLYQIEIYNRKLQAFKTELKRTFSNQKSISTQLNGFSSHETFVFWDVENTDDLSRLHKLVVETFNPFRQGLKVSVVLSAFNSFSSDQQKELDRYGAIGVLDNFHPHITINRLKKLTDVNRAVSSLPKTSKKIIFKKAALGLLSDHGAVVDIIEQYYLS